MSKFKKLTAIVLLVAFSITFMAFGVSAESTSMISLSADKAAVNPDDTLTVSFAVTGSPKGVQGTLEYDSDKFDYVGAVVSNSLADINDANDTFNASVGSVKFAAVASDTTTDGTWFTFTFTAKDNAAGNAEFKVLNAVSAIAGGKETPTVNNLTVSFPSATSGTKGDLNADGEINILDLVRIKKDLANSASVTEVNDLNNDAKFNADDATLMIQYILGTITEF